MYLNKVADEFHLRLLCASTSAFLRGSCQTVYLFNSYGYKLLLRLRF